MCIISIREGFDYKRQKNCDFLKHLKRMILDGLAKLWPKTQGQMPYGELSIYFVGGGGTYIYGGGGICLGILSISQNSASRDLAT